MAMLDGLRDLFMKALFDENDVISRKILVDQWNKECEEVYKYKESLKAEQNYIHAPREGEWNENIIGFCNVCMSCGVIVERTAIKNNSGKLNFCPNCGARMKGGEW